MFASTATSRGELPPSACSGRRELALVVGDGVGNPQRDVSHHQHWQRQHEHLEEEAVALPDAFSGPRTVHAGESICEISLGVR